MKNFTKAIVISLLFCIMFSVLPFEKECRNISSEVLRIHILADSDSEYDQNLKLKVRDEVLEYTEGLFDKAKSKEQAVKIANNNLENIIKVSEKVLESNGCNKPVSAKITDMNFDTRYYDNITMPSGNYTALRITIGSGEGKNWWCVMYPSLCLYTCSDAESLEDKLSDNQYELITDENEYKFKFKIVEYFNIIKNLFT